MHILYFLFYLFIYLVFKCLVISLKMGGLCRTNVAKFIGGVWERWISFRVDFVCRLCIHVCTITRTYFDVIGQFYGHSETLCFLQKEMCLTSGFFPLIVYKLSTCSTCRRKQIVEFKIVRAWIVRDGFRIFNFTRKTAFLKQIRWAIYAIICKAFTVVTLS